MKKLMMVAGAVALVGMTMTGCVTHPLQEQVTEYDKQRFSSENARPMPKRKFNIEIHSSAKAITPHVDKKYIPNINDAMDKSATERLNGLGWFQVANRKDLKILGNSAALSGESNTDSAIMKADLIYVADSTYTLYHKEKSRPCNLARSAGAISIKTDFRLVDVKSGNILVKDSVETMSPRHSKYSQVPVMIPDVVDANVKDFAAMMSARYLPGAPVLETRGAGKCARVQMGKNYQLEPGSKVDFFVDEKQQDGTYSRRVFATGTVLEDGLEEKMSWVEVDNFEVANVHAGHSVKVQESVE